jgi:AcrR family transcriptional regulator
MPPDALLAAALDVFRERGYTETTLDLVARRAQVDLDSVRARFASTDQLLSALLRAYSPLPDMEAALDSVAGESAEELLRDALHRLVKVTQQHAAFFELALLDAQVNRGAFLGNLNAQIFPKAMALLEKMKATGQLRPVPDVILGRTLVSLLLGFVLSERAMPQIARLATRLVPQRAWLDGMIDLLLYGMLEDEAR